MDQPIPVSDKKKKKKGNGGSDAGSRAIENWKLGRPGLIERMLKKKKSSFGKNAHAEHWALAGHWTRSHHTQPKKGNR